MSDVTPKLYSHNQVTVDLLRTIQVEIGGLSEVLLVGVGLSPSWHARKHMPVFYTVSNGKSCLLPFFAPYFFRKKNISSLGVVLYRY